MTMILTGLFESKSVHLSQIANEFPGRAKRPSATKRISRFLNNGAVHVRNWYFKTLQWLIAIAIKTQGEIRLVIDGTKVGNRHQLLMIGLVYRKRTVPLVWTWVRALKGKGHSSGAVQCALLSYLCNFIPNSTRVNVVGDSEFTPLQKLFSSSNWQFVLRQKGTHLIKEKHSETWCHCRDLVTKSGQSVWLENCLLTKASKHETNFLAYWKKGEKEPWLLATNLDSKRQTIQAYKRRMYIEEMFGDFNGNGWDLEKTRLKDFRSLSRLVLLIALLYVWIVTFGTKAIKRGWRDLVDRNDRRDLSIFRIGYDLMNRFLKNNIPILLPDTHSGETVR